MKKQGYYFTTLLFLVLTGSLLAQEAGTASFYHDFFIGKRTASGELYDPKKLTCAHKSLPLGTIIQVTNLANDKTVIVRVNDRGPFVKGRILDLSRSAAQQLGYVGSGMARVSYEILSELNVPLPKDTATLALTPGKMMVITEMDTGQQLGYGVKIASYEDAKFAFVISREMKAKFNLSCYIQTVKLMHGTLYRIFSGNFSSEDQAADLQSQLKKSYPECYVIRYSNFK